MKGKYYKSLTDITIPVKQSYNPNIGKIHVIFGN
jgi:hypothetical protein